MKRQIVRVLPPGEERPYLAFLDGYNKADVVESDPSCTLEELVGLCDRDAENRNAHDFVGAHRLLGAVLFRRLKRKKAAEVMRDVAEYGGLHGMAGVCCDGDAYRALGVGAAGRDWSGEYR